MSAVVVSTVYFDAGTWFEFIQPFAVWLAMAIPTSLIAHRMGKSRWIPFVLWCPLLAPAIAIASFAFLRSLPVYASNGFIEIISWGPGALNLWYLALSKPRDTVINPVFE